MGTLSVSPATWNDRPGTVTSTFASAVSACLACRLDGLLAGIEEDVVGQLDDEPAGPRRHPELARVDHRLELLDEVLEELRARVRRGLCLPQLIESPLCVVERLGQCAPLLEHRVDVLPEPLELSPQLRADRRALVESRLQIVIGGRELAQLLGQVLRLLLGVGQLLPEIGLLGLAGLLARFELGVRPAARRQRSRRTSPSRRTRPGTKGRGSRAPGA